MTSFVSCKKIPLCDGPETLDIGICSLISDYKHYLPFNSFEKVLPLHQIYTLTSVGEINEEKGTITLDLVVKTMWNDTRLVLTNSTKL